jgi:predicted ATPase
VGDALPVAGDRPRHNLPAQLTSFFGRERQIAEVTRLLGTTRLLTLVGAGGVGKTRLALRVAVELLESSTDSPLTFPDGVRLVELAALADPRSARVPQSALVPTLVPGAVTAALDVREQLGRPLTQTLVEFLKSRSPLLVLDNCEHLIAACATLAEHLLRSCPRLSILATSREPLAADGETTWRVSSLSHPDPADPVPLDELTRYESVRLFAARAAAVRPGFAVAERNARAVAQICRTLDGIPLAIELAAARANVLAIEQISARLQDRFRLLTGGSRTAPPRHQTLRATIDWSHDVLGEREQVLFRRLSVFAGGWTLEAAEAVVADDHGEGDDVLDHLSRLVDRSLVSIDASAG